MESGAMGMLGATGGLIIMLFYLLMLFLSILIPFFVWRIWKWSYTTSQELKQLNEKFDRFLTLQQTGVPIEPAAQADAAANAFAAAVWETPAEETAEPEAAGESSESEDPLASAFDADESATEEETSSAAEETVQSSADLGTSPAPADGPEESAEKSGFEFAVSPEEAFGSEEPAVPEAAESPFDIGAEEESTDVAADAMDFTDAPAEESSLGDDFAGDDSAFEFGAEEDAEAANLDQEFDSVFNSDESSTEADPFASFGAEQTDETEDAFQETGEEAPAAEPEPAAEEAPAIIALEPDPQRPTVKLARCGQCDHKLAYKESLRGKKARCPSCQSAFVLP